MTNKINNGYKHLFSTPIDAMFALLPCVFWELMCHEINRHAIQYMEAKKMKYINANHDDTTKEGARAESFVALGSQLVEQNFDWESKYKIIVGDQLFKWLILWIL
jgi:hypothetical protein